MINYGMMHDSASHDGAIDDSMVNGGMVVYAQQEFGSNHCVMGKLRQASRYCSVFSGQVWFCCHLLGWCIWR